MSTRSVARPALRSRGVAAAAIAVVERGSERGAERDADIEHGTANLAAVRPRHRLESRHVLFGARGTHRNVASKLGRDAG